jgi:hypothetical protein
MTRCVPRRTMRRMSTNTNELVARLLETMPATELMRIAPLTEVARLRGTSTDTVLRDDQRRVAKIILARSVSGSKGVLGTLGILNVFVCPSLRSLFRNVRLTDCWADRASA